MIRNLLIIVVVVFSLGGCRTGRPTQETIRTVKDSIWTNVKEIKRDTTITIPGDTTVIRLPIYEITEVPITRTVGRSTATVRRVGDDLEVECECAEYKQKIEYLEKIVSQFQKIQELEKTKVTVTEFRTPWYMKALGAVGSLAILIIGVLAFMKLLPIISKLKPF